MTAKNNNKKDLNLSNARLMQQYVIKNNVKHVKYTRSSLIEKTDFAGLLLLIITCLPCVLLKKS